MYMYLDYICKKQDDISQYRSSDSPGQIRVIWNFTNNFLVFSSKNKKQSSRQQNFVFSFTSLQQYELSIYIY